MMIINNNNNNNNRNSSATVRAVVPTSAPVLPNREKTEKKAGFDPFSGPRDHSRATMILLARYMGWSGMHYFHFKKPLLGALHLIFSIIGIIGCGSIWYILLYVQEPKLYLQIAIGLIPALLLSALSGIICSLYWTMQTDSEFEKAYPPPQEPEEKKK